MPMNGYLIRKPTAEEVHKLFDLQNSSSQRIQTQQELIESHAIFPDGFYVCSAGHSILGFVNSEIWDTNLIDPKVHYDSHSIAKVHEPKGTLGGISNLTVTAPYYLQVIGYRLIEHLISEVVYRKPHVTSFCSVVDSDNELMNHFYKHNRFAYVRNHEQHSIYHRSVKIGNG